MQLSLYTCVYVCIKYFYFLKLEKVFNYVIGCQYIYLFLSKTCILCVCSCVLSPSLNYVCLHQDEGAL